ncbi:MAG: AraC family transcriptional regulator [Clostridiales bacterium]|jgi:AraC-like DNA-binding protein|nr:AraC family transcriptional regulator [Clostridiales bacterium]
MSNFYRHTLTDVIRVTTVVTIHYFRYAKTFAVPGESHDFYEAVYADSGSVTVTDGADTHVLKQGQCILHAPDVFHKVKANNEYSNIVIFTFDCAGLPAALCGRVFSTLPAERRLVAELVREGEQGFVEPLDIVDLQKMNQKIDAPVGNLQRIKNNIENFLLLLIRKTAQNPKKPTPPAKGDTPSDDAPPSPAAQTLAYLKENLNRRVTMADLSAALGYSAVYLKDVFRRAYGGGIITCHTKLKLDAAKRLLSEGVSVGDIAESLGFYSPQHFSHTFRKFTNMTPTVYRRSVQADLLLF